jgi:hypothetical protein
MSTSARREEEWKKISWLYWLDSMRGASHIPIPILVGW